MKDISIIVIGAGIAGSAIAYVPNDKVEIITAKLDEIGQPYSINPENFPYEKFTNDFIQELAELKESSLKLDYERIEGILNEEKYRFHKTLDKNHSYTHYQKKLNSPNKSGPKFYKGAGRSMQKFG